MNPDELVRATLDLEARFLEELGEHDKAEAVRNREPAEPAPNSHTPFASPFRAITVLGDGEQSFMSGAGTWSATYRALEPPERPFLADQFVRFLPQLPGVVFHPVEESSPTEET